MLEYDLRRVQSPLDKELKQQAEGSVVVASRFLY